MSQRYGKNHTRADFYRILSYNFPTDFNSRKQCSLGGGYDGEGLEIGQATDMSSRARGGEEEIGVESPSGTSLL